MGGGNSKHQDEVGRDPPAPQVADSDSPTIETENKGGEESKCPMHNRDGSYTYDWKQLFKAAAVHGPQGSEPLSQEQQDQAKSQVATDSSSGSCPVKHSTSTLKAEGGCPVKHNSSGAAHPEYDVYSQPIDKTNQMPKGVKTQMPTSTQKADISTDRVNSTIPKHSSESDTTWTYPSPQQFYNSLSRKGKLGDDTSEHDMESVVALHNNMNEKTWAQVVEWERQTYNRNTTPKLLKFMGRPHDLSPKAALKHYLLGHPLPYDRHDWTVLRDDGTTVRYVIDYYYDETRARESEESAKPSLHDRDATPSLLIDVRPALDGPTQFAARAFQMPYRLMSNQTTFQSLPLRGTPEMVSQVKESVKVWQSIQTSRQEELQAEQHKASPIKISDLEARKIAVNFAEVLKTCRSQTTRLESCKSEKDYSKASMDLTMCMGPILCPVQHRSLMKTLTGEDDVKIDVALETLSECVVMQTAQRSLARKQYPKLFKD